MNENYPGEWIGDTADSVCNNMHDLLSALEESAWQFYNGEWGDPKGDFDAAVDAAMAHLDDSFPSTTWLLWGEGNPGISRDALLRAVRSALRGRIITQPTPASERTQPMAPLPTYMATDAREEDFTYEDVKELPFGELDETLTRAPNKLTRDPVAYDALLSATRSLADTFSKARLAWYAEYMANDDEGVMNVIGTVGIDLRIDAILLGRLWRRLAGYDSRAGYQWICDRLLLAISQLTLAVGNCSKAARIADDRSRDHEAHDDAKLKAEQRELVRVTERHICHAVSQLKTLLPTLSDGRKEGKRARQSINHQMDECLVSLELLGHDYI